MTSTKASPTPNVIRATRDRLELSRVEAARLIYCGERAWQEWELGNRQMHPAFWELFNVKSDAKKARKS